MPVVELKIPDLDKFLAAAEKQYEAAERFMKAMEMAEGMVKRISFFNQGMETKS